MNRNFRSSRLIIVLLITLASGLLKAQDFPPRAATLVTDFTNTLSEGEKNSLERKLVAFNDSTTTQIAVVIMTSTGEYEISSYAVQLFQKWGIGQKDRNNGVLLLVAKGDRKVFINTGFGIEGVLPDALCKRIIENDILPEFRNGNYYAGIEAGTNAIMSIVAGEYSADDYMSQGQKVPVFPILLGFLIFFIVIFAQFRRVGRYARTNHLGFWAAWALLNAAANRSRGSWGGFSGGGGFGGGFGGGGFGGFGGGSSGGGGAGGSW